MTLHTFMMRACGIDWTPDLSRDFYEKELPAMFMAAEDVPAYDLVIIDEGQDLLTNTYLECIDRIVQDGLGDGTWAIYYDPNQNIFNSYAELDAMIEKLRKEAYAMSWKLHANCRNTKQIANANILMTNIPNQGKPTVSGPQVEYDSYTGKEDECRKINVIVSDENARLLNYVAASRACAMLYILYDRNAEQERQNMIMSGFAQVGT